MDARTGERPRELNLPLQKPSSAEYPSRFRHYSQEAIQVYEDYLQFSRKETQGFSEKRSALLAAPVGRDIENDSKNKNF